MKPRQMVKAKPGKQKQNKGTYMHIHTNALKKPKQTKENKVQESEPANKRNQRWCQPMKAKLTKRENKNKAER